MTSPKRIEPITTPQKTSKHERGYIHTLIRRFEYLTQQLACERPAEVHAKQRQELWALRWALEGRGVVLPRPGAEAPVRVRPVVVAFARAMETELAANDHKGGWEDDDPDQLFDRLVEEVDELRIIVEANANVSASVWAADVVAKVLSEAADVANFALMIADRVGALATDGSSLHGLAGRYVLTPEAYEEMHRAIAADNGFGWGVWCEPDDGTEGNWWSERAGDGEWQRVEFLRERDAIGCAASRRSEGFRFEARRLPRASA